MTVKELIERLQTMPQDLPVAYPEWESVAHLDGPPNQQVIQRVEMKPRDFWLWGGQDAVLLA